MCKGANLHGEETADNKELIVIVLVGLSEQQFKKGGITKNLATFSAEFLELIKDIYIFLDSAILSPSTTSQATAPDHSE